MFTVNIIREMQTKTTVRYHKEGGYYKKYSQGYERVRKLLPGK